MNIPLTAFAEDVEETTDVYEPSAPFVMLATDENGGITISCNKVEYFGNLSSASKINIWASEVKGNGLKLEQVDYKALYGKNANNGSSPFGYAKTPDLIITDYKGTKHTYKTPLFKNPINLI